MSQNEPALKLVAMRYASMLEELTAKADFPVKRVYELWAEPLSKRSMIEQAEIARVRSFVMNGLRHDK